MMVTSRQGTKIARKQTEAVTAGCGDSICIHSTMSLQKKLDFIDDEIRKIHMFCTKSGYSACQIESFAKPFFQRESHHLTTSIWVSGKAWKRRGVALATVIIATIFLFRFDPAYRLACAMSKQGAIKILPLWDWTQLYHTRCWVSNPLYKQPQGLQFADCEICEGIEAVKRVEDLDGLSLIKHYLSRDQPLIIQDGLKNWGHLTNISIVTLAKNYREDPVLKRYNSCGFSSNIRVPGSDHVDLLTLVKDGDVNKFYAQWENCNVLAAKAFRRLYKRPYFLPPTVSLAQRNGVFISSNYSGRIYKPVEMNERMMIFIQIKGETTLKLEPWEPCNEHCHVFYERLIAGQILVSTAFMWKVDYLPSRSPENIAIALGGGFA